MGIEHIYISQKDCINAAHPADQRRRTDGGRSNARVILPLPPESPDDKLEMEVYARFMRFLRQSPNSRMDIKILSAIHSSAENLSMGEDAVAKILVDLGLRAPKMAFPAPFLRFCDLSLKRAAGEMASSLQAVKELYRHWAVMGETSSEYGCAEKHFIKEHA